MARTTLALIAAAFAFAAGGTAAAASNAAAASLAFVGGAFAVIAALWHKDAQHA